MMIAVLERLRAAGEGGRAHSTTLSNPEAFKALISRTKHPGVKDQTLSRSFPRLLDKSAPVSLLTSMALSLGSEGSG